MTATPQPESKSPTSRRALLAGALGGLGALAASAIGRASPVRAADGDNALLGTANTSTTATSFENTDPGETSLWGTHSGSGFGVVGTSTSYIGVFGRSDASQPATVGKSTGNSTGVQGYSGTSALPAAKAKTGVHGYAAQDGGSRGVTGESPAGIGVYGITTSGYAGYFAGKVYSTKWYEMTEITAPAAPSANRARLFLTDNGLGKTQLCVRFNTGAVHVIATQA
jgi:hypothetical protein